MDFLDGASGKEPACQCRGRVRDAGSILGVGKIPWRRAWQSTPVFLPENPTEEPLQSIESHRVGQN